MRGSIMAIATVAACLVHGFFGPTAGGSSTPWTVHKHSFAPSDNTCFELSFVSAGADYRYDHADAELSSRNDSVGGYIDGDP